MADAILILTSAPVLRLVTAAFLAIIGMRMALVRKVRLGTIRGRMKGSIPIVSSAKIRELLSWSALWCRSLQPTTGGHTRWRDIKALGVAASFDNPKYIFTSYTTSQALGPNIAVEQQRAKKAPHGRDWILSDHLSLSDLLARYSPLGMQHVSNIGTRLTYWVRVGGQIFSLVLFSEILVRYSECSQAVT
jgi:hypothetical protein